MGLWFIKPDIKRLSEQGDVARLVRALRHKKSTIRKDAADALGKLETKTAVNELVLLLKDSEYEVRLAAADALGNLDDKKATQPLLDVINSSRPWSYLRIIVLRSLGKIGWKHAGKSAVEIVLQVLEEAIDPSQDLPELHKSNYLADVRLAAVQALGIIRDAESVTILKRILQDIHERADVKEAAMKAFVQVHGAKGKPKIPTCRKCKRILYTGKSKWAMMGIAADEVGRRSEGWKVGIKCAACSWVFCLSCASPRERTHLGPGNCPHCSGQTWKSL